MNFIKAAFFAALLTASPTRGDLLLGDMVKATGGGGADALDGRSNEGLGVVRSWYFSNMVSFIHS
jgi:hypothetical protein